MTGKNDRPPPLPSEVLGRVLRVATFDGRTLLFFAGGFALLAAAGREGLGAAAGCLAAGAGAMELHGAGRLRQGLADGMAWLVRSQLALLVVVLVYVMVRITGFDPEHVRTAITPEMEASFDAAGIPDDQVIPLFKLVHLVIYSVVALVSVVYQGGMALYYHRRRGPVQAALAAG